MPSRLQLMLRQSRLHLARLPNDFWLKLVSASKKPIIFSLIFVLSVAARQAADAAAEQATAVMFVDSLDYVG